MYERILVVCTGNICRSPVAEYLIREALLKAGRKPEVRSAGVGALVDHPADEMALGIMGERGVDLSPHRAQQVTVSLCRWAELVLVMEGHHRDALGDIDSAVRGKIFLLGHWQKRQIPDPYRRSRGAWDDTVKLIDEGIVSWVKRL
jgi:protein-tyrosine phosphatase